jgi:ribosomal protein S8
MSTIIIKKEIDVPTGILIAVADKLIEYGLAHSITATDEDNDSVTLEVEYGKDEKEVIHEIEDLITDFEEQDAEDGEEDEEEG